MLIFNSTVTIAIPFKLPCLMYPPTKDPHAQDNSEAIKFEIFKSLLYLVEAQTYINYIYTK